MNFYQELKNLEDKQLSYKKAYDNVRLRLDTIPCEWGDKNIFRGLHSITMFGFTNVFSIAVVKLKIIYL